MEEDIDERNSHAVNLDPDLFARKIATLTERLELAFDCHPYSYRAGRWGVSGEHLQVLSDAGYRVDSSVRPFYADRDFSYATAPTSPYWPSFASVVERDDAQNGILEIPVSGGFDRPSFETLDRLHSMLSSAPLNRLRLIGVLWRLRLLRKITVTPEGYASRDICRCIDAIVARGDRVINLFFHSSDLLPGCTPYVRDGDERARFLDCLGRVIDHVRERHGADFVTMREIRHRLTGAT